MLEPQLPSVVHYVMPKGLGGALAQGNTAATVLRDADSETEKVLRDDSNLICMLCHGLFYTQNVEGCSDCVVIGLEIHPGCGSAYVWLQHWTHAYT